MADKSRAPRWDLESLFSGGSNSAEFKRFRQTIKSDIQNAEAELAKLSGKYGQADYKAWAGMILSLQELYKNIYHASSFAGCLISQDVDDTEALSINAEVDNYAAQWQSLMTGVEEFSLKLADAEWEKFIASNGLTEIRFFLVQMRDKARDKMPPEFERLVLDLAVDGYHGWNRLYDKMAGDLRVEFPVNGESKRMSLGQLAPKFDSPDRAIRKLAFDKTQEAWETRAQLAALTLNSQAGFRLALYKNRGWDSPLHEPLKNARIKRETLDAMWSIVAQAAPAFKKYIDARKQLLGIDKYTWYDQTASIGKLEKTYSFQEAGDFIVEHLGSFSKEMGEFSRLALDKRWIEGEDRPGKAAGGFCTGMPVAKQTRIFMTYTGTFGGLSTLAHELGHAYHSWVLKDRPIFASRYPMTLAETASTFNELRVKDAALQLADEPMGKLSLLDQKLQDGYTMICNIHARFLFDQAFYEERKQGLVSRDRLDQLMVEAQRRAYAGTLDEPDGWHPLFWASKLHFFFTGVPFYNFPYTFGFLFSLGIYDRALKEGQSFAKSYRNLLADTGSMMTEEVASKHMGVDLTKEDYWRDAVNRVLLDIEPYIELAKDAAMAI